MKETAGRVGYYIDKDGKRQYCIARNVEQTPEFSKYNHVFLRLVDENYRAVMLNNKQVISVKIKSEVNFIGFTD